jgi:hypothetical protein
MSKRRRFPRLLALGLAFSLLAAQWALAVYACPLEQRVSAMAAMRVAGLPCHEADEDQPALCHQHMVQAAQSAETARTPLPALPDAAPLRSVSPLVLEDGAGRADWAPLAAAQGPPPSHPVYLATRRLRC